METAQINDIIKYIRPDYKISGILKFAFLQEACRRRADYALTNIEEIVTLKDNNQYLKTAKKRRVAGGWIYRESQKLKRDDDGYRRTWSWSFGAERKAAERMFEGSCPKVRL